MNLILRTDESRQLLERCIQLKAETFADLAKKGWKPCYALPVELRDLAAMEEKMERIAQSYLANRSIVKKFRFINAKNKRHLMIRISNLGYVKQEFTPARASRLED